MKKINLKKLFHKLTFKMYILADIKTRFSQQQILLFNLFKYKQFLFFNVKDLIYYNHICEMNILADINEIVEKKDL